MEVVPIDRKQVKPIRKDNESRTCVTCGELLVRWIRDGRKEQHGNFRKRRFCDDECRKNGPVPTGAKLDLSQLGPGKRVANFVVYFSQEGRPFILAPRMGRTEQRITRFYGEISNCLRCEREFFHRKTGSPRWQHCSKKCAAPKTKKTKRQQVLDRGGPKKAVLDMWFARVIRSVGRCHRCGATTSLQCAHVLSRRYMGVRFDERNAICLCARCHMFFTHRPLEWEEYVLGFMGADLFAELKRIAREFQGPLDRKEIAKQLYNRAGELGLSKAKSATGGTIKGLFDPEAERRTEIP